MFIFLLKKNYIRSATMATVLSRQYSFSIINLFEWDVPSEASVNMSYKLT